VGSGVIPALHRPHSSIDESLALAFGGYPRHFRGGLGGPRRGITLLEIGKLEAPLETALRNPASRQQALASITTRVVNALELGVGGVAEPTAAHSTPASAHSPVGLATGGQ
jgi:hypothetical protein